MAKLSRAQLKRMDAEVAELEEIRDELKRKRPRCETCNRLKVVKGSSKLEDEIRANGVELFEKRSAYRVAREESGYV